MSSDSDHDPLPGEAEALPAEPERPPAEPELWPAKAERPPAEAERRVSVVREALADQLSEWGWLVSLPPRPREGHWLWSRIVGQCERVSWHAAAVIWAAFVGLWVALMCYRAFMRSSLATLLESKDVPFLAYMDQWFPAYALGCAALGVACLALACGYLWGERRSRARQLLAGGSVLAVGLCAITLRHTKSAAGALEVSNTGVWDWLLLATFLALPWLASRCAAEGRARELSPRPRPIAEDPYPYALALLYLLSVLVIGGLAMDEHRVLWDSNSNGGYNYLRFFAGPEEAALADRVLYSTSLLFGSLAAGLALLAQLAYRLSAQREGEDRWPALRRRCLLVALGLCLIATLPWMAKASREIRGEANYFFPLGLMGCIWACVYPLLFASASLLERDLDQDGVGLSRWGEAGRLLFVTLSFPIYPLLRGVRIGPLRALTRVWYSLAGVALLVVFVWAGYRLDKLWEFEDWRGMMKSGQFPATRVAVSLLGASAIFLALGGLRRRLGKACGVPAAGASLLLLLAASWPLWGWGQIPRNVHTRCVEFSTRHTFERRFLCWLLDLDRDGYAALLDGGDPDDSRADIQGAGLPPLVEVALPQDSFLIEDAARAAAFPNLVLLTLEGVTPTSITAYGKRPLLKRPSTPALDALAAGGARFTRAYAAYPSTWDGWFMVHAGRTLSVQEFDSSQPFGDRYTRYGNLHKLLRRLGFDRFCYPDTTPYAQLFVPAEERPGYFEPEFKATRTSAERKSGVTLGDKRTDRLVRFIESVQPGERFFVTEHMADTHFPWERVKQERAKELGYPEGLGWVEVDAEMDEVKIPRMARYYHEITRMDTQIGRVVTALKARGLFEQTLIVVVSDHGCQWYEHEHGYYVSHLYEQSLRIPLIIHGPGIPHGLVRDQPVTQIDVLPTLVELAGAGVVDPARPLEGRSMVPLLQPAPPSPAVAQGYRERTLLLKTHYDTLGVLVDFRYKLIFDRPTGVQWLFDLSRDPREMTNLIDSEPELAARLGARLVEKSREQMVFLGGLKRSEPAGE